MAHKNIALKTAYDLVQFCKTAATKDIIPGGKSSGKSKRKYDPKQVAMGAKVEREHTPSRAAAREIARDHLEEFPDYYSRLAKMEEQAKKSLKKESADKVYWQGFIDRCARHNVDPDFLSKYAYEQWAAMPPPTIYRNNYYSDTGRSATVGSSRTPRTAATTPAQRASSKPAKNRSERQSTTNGGGSSFRATTTRNAPRAETGSTRTQRVGREHTYRAPARQPESHVQPEVYRRKQWLSAVRYDSPNPPWAEGAALSMQSPFGDASSGIPQVGLGGLLGALAGAMGGSDAAPTGGGDGGGDGGGGGE